MADSLKERLVDAALKLLEDGGPKAFSQARVAKEAGIQQGHLTYYFPRKADLVAAVLERFAEEGDASFRRLAEKVAGSERAVLEAVAVNQVRTLIRDRRRIRALLSLLVQGFEDPDILRTLEERGLTNRVFLAGFLGREPGDPDVELAFATLRGLALQNLLHRYDARRVDQLVARFRQWLDALPPRKDAP
ncbi:MAG: TetR/AcrR family transcriptional regulator [Myxococcales bacterium]|nr:TetR/AcrR family transcriptional regulator [Myxococcales bacterium]